MEDTYCDLFNPTVTNGTVTGTCRCSGSERCGTCTRGVQLSKGQCVLDQPVTNSRCSSETEGKPDDAGNKCDQHSIGTCTGGGGNECTNVYDVTDSNGADVYATSTSGPYSRCVSYFGPDDLGNTERFARKDDLGNTCVWKATNLCTYSTEIEGYHRVNGECEQCPTNVIGKYSKRTLFRKM